LQGMINSCRYVRDPLAHPAKSFIANATEPKPEMMS
jgi:hypothetical protein